MALTVYLDSTVLAYVMKTLNERYQYGLELFLLSIDEGITGYRDDSLEVTIHLPCLSISDRISINISKTVKRNQLQYDMPLKILSYNELYGWTMDAVVAQIGRKNNCTFCGVFRRQALDRGAAMLNVDHIVTGHNADDIAETVLMNSESSLCSQRSFVISIISSSHARRHCTARPMYINMYARRGHNQTFKAVQVCVRKGNCHVCTSISLFSFSICRQTVGMHTSRNLTTSPPSVYTLLTHIVDMHEHSSKTWKRLDQVPS
jgi:hypothetical protein